MALTLATLLASRAAREFRFAVEAPRELVPVAGVTLAPPRGLRLRVWAVSR